MKKVIDLRKQFGLTQEQLANYLGISRSTLNMYEQGQRSLSSGALLKLGRLEIAYMAAKESRLQKIKEIKTFAASDNTARIINSLQQKVMECRRLAVVLEKRLQEARQQYDNLGSLVVLTEIIAVDLPGDEDMIADNMWLDIVKKDAYRQAVVVGPEEQFLLQHRINLLLKEAAAHEAALDQLASGMFKNEM